MKRIIVANSNQCRIFDYQRPGQLTLVKEISCPENKLRNSELAADGAGRYKVGWKAFGTYSPTDLKKVHIDNFARKLAVELERERNRHDYHELIVVMPAHMDGLLLQHLNKNVRLLIKRIIQKNIMNLSQRNLLSYLNRNLL